MRQIWPSRLVSACSFSTLRLNLVLTHGIALDVHGGVYIFFLHPLRYKVCSNTKYRILVLQYTTAVLHGHVFCLYKNKKNKLRSTSNL